MATNTGVDRVSEWFVDGESKGFIARRTENRRGKCYRHGRIRTRQQALDLTTWYAFRQASEPEPVPAHVDPLLASLRKKVVHIPGEAGKPLTWEQLEKPHFVYGFRVNGKDGVDEVKRGYSHNPEDVLRTAQRFTSRKLVLAFTIMVYTPGENNRAAAYALEQQMLKQDASHLIPGGGDEVFDLDILPNWTEADLIDGEVVPKSSSVEIEVWKVAA